MRRSAPWTSFVTEVMPQLDQVNGRSPEWDQAPPAPRCAGRSNTISTWSPLGRPVLSRHRQQRVNTVLSGTIEGQFPAAPPLLALGLDARVRGRGDGDAHSAVADAVQRLRSRGRRRPVWLWLAHDPELPGVNAARKTAHAVAAAWARRTGGSPDVGRHDHSLETVTDPPRPGPGRLFRPRGRPRLAVRWFNEFVIESHVIDAGPDTRAARSTRGSRADELWLWEDEGAAVSMVGLNPAVAGVVRSAPSTPRSEPGAAGMPVPPWPRGAARPWTGAHTCMLFTDLANPTSNKIYADVGYRRFGDGRRPSSRRPAPTHALSRSPLIAFVSTADASRALSFYRDRLAALVSEPPSPGVRRHGDDAPGHDRRHWYRRLTPSWAGRSLTSRPRSTTWPPRASRSRSSSAWTRTGAALDLSGRRPHRLVSRPRRQRPVAHPVWVTSAAGPDKA